MSSSADVQHSFDPLQLGGSRWAASRPIKPIGWAGLETHSASSNSLKFAWSSWLPNQSTGHVTQEDRVCLEASGLWAPEAIASRMEQQQQMEEVGHTSFDNAETAPWRQTASEAWSNMGAPWPAATGGGNPEMEGLRRLRNSGAQMGASPSLGQTLGDFSGYTSQLQHWPQASDLPLKIPFPTERETQGIDSSQAQATTQATALDPFADWNETGKASNHQQPQRLAAPPPGQGPGPPQPGPPQQQQQSLAKPMNQTQAFPPPPPHWQDGQCRWHKSAETVGVISEDGHVFTKTAGPRRSRVNNRGSTVELASICMVFDASLRSGGVHRYCYEILDGELGVADGVGFVFDSKVRRNNIQRMRSVFLNQRGRICLRNNQQVTKLEVQLPPLTVGVCLHLLVDLDSLVARFNVSNSQGVIGGSADVSLEGLFDNGLTAGQLRSGFFCAVVTGSITIGLR